MFYKYKVSYRNGTELSGYAVSDKPLREVRMGIARKFFGDFNLTVEKHGMKFPKCNSDYIITV